MLNTSSQSAGGLCRVACLQMTGMGLEKSGFYTCQRRDADGVINFTEERSRSPENLNGEKQGAFSKKINVTAAKVKF